MPRINLLPWRAELREKRKKDFMIAMLAAVLIGGLAVYGAKLMVESRIAGQNARNALLTSEISKLDKQIKQISGLEDQKKRLIARMQIIDELQRSRPEVVHLFDELVNTLPEGVYLTAVKQTGNRIEIRGEAQSSTRVSALMRNIDRSKWLEKPSLDVVETPNNSSQFSRFTIHCQEVAMNDPSADAPRQAAKAAKKKPKARRAK
jgi:type IV pilus assembly protein PilN